MTDPWFGEGLRFSCIRCGRCCGGEPGYVLVESDEIARIGAFLGVGKAVFRRRFTRRVRAGERSLTEEKNGDCSLLGKGGCRVYGARPRQCRTYPFWPEVIRGRASWERESLNCPGMDHGRLWRPADWEAIGDDGE